MDDPRSPSADDGTHTDDSGPRPKSREVLAPGEMIGRYQIAEALGAGGMGVVYRARDPDLGRDVAIKVLQQTAEPGTPPADSHGKRLLREAQAMARLKHPNIVTVYDVGSFRGRVFLAMEYVDGSTLKGWLRGGGHEWRERLDVLLAAGRGLAAAHDAGVVHRDFKPDNVLIDAMGHVQVVDFGLARSVGDSELERTEDGAPRLPAPTDDALDLQLTRTGAVVGTPAYMSPEQFLGQSVDARSDQFSFAVVAFEALWGMRPFPGVTAQEVMSAVARGAPVRAPAGDVPPAVATAIGRGLAPNPADRFPTMPAFLDALERAAGGAARPRRTQLWIAAALSAAAIGLGVTALVATGGGASDDPVEPTSTVPPPAPTAPGPRPLPGPLVPKPLPPREPEVDRIDRAIEIFVESEAEDGEADGWGGWLRREITDEVRREIARELAREMRDEGGDPDGLEARIKRRVLERIRRDYAPDERTE